MADGTGKAHTGACARPPNRMRRAKQRREGRDHHDHRDIVQPPSLHHRTLAASAAAALGLAGCAPQGTPTAATAATSRRAGAAAGNAPAESAPASDVPAWLGERPAITDADCAETVDCEVLVIGAGCSGLVAANFAAMEGAKTLLIEKFDKGTGLRGSAIGAVGSRKQQEAGVNIDPQEICNDLVHYSLNNASMDLYQLWAAHSAEAVNWYCDLTDGVDQCKIDLEWSMPAEETRYKCWPTGHGAMLDNGKAGKDEASGEGVTYAQVEANFLAQPNAELRYLTSLECLIKEGDKVVGAYASTDEGATFLRINAAKGVIVATGGYANNPDMYMALQAENAKGLCGVVPFGNFNAQGQGIKACLWAGAVKDENPTSMVFDRGIMRPDQLPGAPFDMDFGYFHMATQPFLKVDIEGERITNESSPYDFLIHGPGAQVQPARLVRHLGFQLAHRHPALPHHRLLGPHQGRGHQPDGIPRALRARPPSSMLWWKRARS